MIFSRSCRAGNARQDLSRRLCLMLVAGGLGLAGCVSPPSFPANVILRDVHNNGYSLAFDARSETLASGGSEGHIRLWRLPDGKPLANWKAHTGSLQGIQFINHDQELLSAAYDAALVRWTLTGAVLQRVVSPSPITSMSADENTAVIVTGHHNGHVRVWRMTDFSLLSDERRHRGAVRAIAYHAATQQIASSGTDGRVFHWRPGEEPQPLPPPPTDAQDLAFSPDGSYLMGSGWFKMFRWRFSHHDLQILDTPHHGIVKSISFNRDGRTLASIGRQTDSAVYLLDAETGAVVKRFQPHELCGSFVRLSPNGRYLASTSDDANVHIWDLRHPLPEQTFYSK